MLLRASGEFELRSVMDEDINSGVEHGQIIRELVDAAILNDWTRLSELRPRALEQMSARDMVDSLTVASSFNGITRIADAIGIPLDSGPKETSAQMRIDVGINDFHYSEKSRRYDFVAS